MIVTLSNHKYLATDYTRTDKIKELCASWGTVIFLLKAFLNIQLLLGSLSEHFKENLMRKWALRRHACSVPARCPHSAHCAFEGCGSWGVDQPPLAGRTGPGWKRGTAPEQSPGHSGKLSMWRPGWLPLFTEQLLAEPRSQAFASLQCPPVADVCQGNGQAQAQQH